MANKILTAEGWQQRIRDKLGLDAAYLPDSVIEQPDYITIAEANIIKQLPDYAEFDDDLKAYLESAVVSECAVLICPSLQIRLPSKETGPHESHELGVNWKDIQAKLEADRDANIGRISDTISPESGISSLLHFRITKPIRY